MKKTITENSLNYVLTGDYYIPYLTIPPCSSKTFLHFSIFIITDLCTTFYIIGFTSRRIYALLL